MTDPPSSPSPDQSALDVQAFKGARLAYALDDTDLVGVILGARARMRTSRDQLQCEIAFLRGLEAALCARMLDPSVDVGVVRFKGLRMILTCLEGWPQVTILDEPASESGPS